jgi:predicted MPP superfamily phosphohydrolase
MSEIKTFNFQVVSDLHLEFQIGFPNITPKSEFIFLLGDIGSPLKDNYWQFIENLSKKFMMVYIITGNHEYYGSTIDYIDNLINTKIKEYRNVVFLNGRKGGIFRIYDTIILGTTLWSYIPPEHMLEVKNKLNDYKYIQNFTPELCNIMFNDNVNWILETLQQFKYNPVIILSHHTPLINGTSLPQHENTPTNHAFSSDLSFILPRIHTWCYGHTHFNHPEGKFNFSNTQLISNQKGYGDKIIKYYDPNRVYKLT